MSNSEKDDCGICPFTFRGWMKSACRWHDQAYKKDSWHQQNLSREYVDRVFLNQLLELAERGTFTLGKKAQAYAAYAFVRQFGSLWWEGVEYGEPTPQKKELVAAVYKGSELSSRSFIV